MPKTFNELTDYASNISFPNREMSQDELKLTHALQDAIDRRYTAKEKPLKRELQAYQEKVEADPSAGNRAIRDKLQEDLDNLYVEWRAACVQVAYCRGTVAGARLGIRLAGYLDAMDGSHPADGNILPGLPEQGFSLFLARAMVDEQAGDDLVQAMLEHAAGRDLW